VLLACAPPPVPCPRYKEKVFKSSLNIAAAAISTALGMDIAVKEAPVVAVGVQLPMVTVNPEAQGEIEAGFSTPCTVDIVREPLYTMLCGADADLGKANMG